MNPALLIAPAQAPPAVRVRAFWFAVLTVLGIWPALTNGQPFFYADTTAYVRGADLAISKALGSRFATDWAKDQRRAIETQTSAGSELSFPGQKPARRVVLAGRSIIYGALLYLGALTGGMWFSIIVQSLVAVYLVFLLMVRTLRLGFRHFLAGCGVLLLTSPLPFCVSFLMPDVFAGFLILGFAILATSWDRLSNTERTITGAVLFFAVLSHTTHVILLIGLTALTAAYAGLIDRSEWPRIRGLAATSAACVLVAVVWEAAFSFGVNRALGTPPVRPPFVTAKLVEMLGQSAVTQVCVSKQFAVCQFRERLPVDYETFPRNLGRFASGIFHGASRQLTVFGLGEYWYGAQGLEFFKKRLPAPDFERMASSLAASWRGYVVFGGTVLYLTAALGAAAIAALLRGARRPTSVSEEGGTRREDAWRAATYIQLVGILVNAVICGGFGSVNNRYEARVVWLIQLSSFAGVCVMWPHWKVASWFTRNPKKIVVSGL